MKKTSVITLILLMAILATSCGQKTGGAEVDNDAGNTTTTVSEDISGEQESEKKAVYGEVYEVIGNLITIKLIEMPEGGINFAGGMGNASGFANIEIPEEFAGMSREEIMEQFNNGEMPAGMPEGGQGNFIVNGTPPENMTDENGNPATITRGNRQPSTDENGQPITDENGEPVQERIGFEIKYTGEQVDIIIPVGIPITTKTMVENELKDSEVNIDTVKAGNYLYVTYADDGVTVESVMLVQGNMGGGMRVSRGEGNVQDIQPITT